ncbi:hypothetical protein VIGAN_09093900, partial [Vigna angularis var. angularis]
VTSPPNGSCIRSLEKILKVVEKVRRNLTELSRMMKLSCEGTLLAHVRTNLQKDVGKSEDNLSKLSSMRKLICEIT